MIVRRVILNEKSRSFENHVQDRESNDRRSQNCLKIAFRDKVDEHGRVREKFTVEYCLSFMSTIIDESKSFH